METTSATTTSLAAIQDPRVLRDLFRTGELVRQTSGLVPGRVQANLAILPAAEAVDFEAFCRQNPKPCPLLEVLPAGSWEPTEMAPGADLRHDLPLYRIFRNGELTGEVTDIADLWRDDFVSFLIGCSFTFEQALIHTGIPVRHVDCGTNVPMYITSVPTQPAGAFSGALVVSMRPIPEARVAEAAAITGRYPDVHGAPVHIGDPAAIGIQDIARPDFGDPVEIRAGEVPVFWACGVTPQVAAMASKPSLMITHAPGHMFLTDRFDRDYEVVK